MAARQALNLQPVVRLHLPHPALLALLFIIHHYFEREECSQTEAFSIATAITTAGEAIGSGVSVAWDICTANPWLTLLIGVSLVGVGFGFFKKAKRTVR